MSNGRNWGLRTHNVALDLRPAVEPASDAVDASDSQRGA